MHYDGGRDDLPFWPDVARAPYPDSYARLKQCVARRTPRVVDFEHYAAPGWQSLLHSIDWLLVGAPLGVIAPEGARAELSSLTNDERARVSAHLAAREMRVANA